ncbi:hypothetical protein KKB18_12330, partial [bacterium]|nr:hypothetical protein [bacterium]
MRFLKHSFVFLIALSSLLLCSRLEGKVLFNTKLHFSEEYTDNVFYRSKEKIDSYISIVNPELSLNLVDSKNLFSVNYNFYYTYYDNEKARKLRSKYHHDGLLNLDYFLTENLEFKISSRQRYSDIASIIDIDHELTQKDKVLRSYNESSLTYNYGLRRLFGVKYRYIFFKNYSDLPIFKEHNYTNSVGGFFDHAFNARNSIASDYNFYFGKYFLGGKDKYLGRKWVHDGSLSYRYRINSVLFNSISYLSKYWDYPEQTSDGKTEEIKHISYEMRDTLNYDITEILTSSYWIGYNLNRKKVLTEWKDYKTMTGGLNFLLHMNRLSVNALSSYGIRETLYYTTRE